MKAVLRGIGLWAPGYAGLDAWLAGKADPEVQRPRAARLPARLRRRTSLLTRMVVDAIEEAGAAGGADPSRARIVLSSTWGELETTIDLLGQLAVPRGPVSPTAFHNSVHNTATGYLSIATGNRGGASAIAAGPDGVAMGLLEAFMLLQGDAEDVVLVCADEAVPEPFAAPGETHALAAALHLSTKPGGRVNRAVRLERVEFPTDASGTEIGMDYIHASVGPILRALVSGGDGAVSLGSGGSSRWQLVVGT